MIRQPSLAVVVPFFNEECSVVPVCRELQAVLEYDFPSAEIIVVNDGSSDHTGARLEEVAASWPTCRVFHLEENQGQATALLFGFGKTVAPIIVTMDGDGQNDPHDIKRLVPRLEEADMVVGIRTNRQNFWMRRKISRMANAVRSKLLGDGISDAGCGLKAFRREVVGAFIPIRTLCSFMPALAVAAGFCVVEERVHHRLRRHGASRHTAGSLLILPIIDLIGLKWFGARRCRVRSIKPRRAGTIGLGEELYRRAFRRWWKMVGYTLVGALVAVVFLLPARQPLGTRGRRIGLHRAERIALMQVPKGRLGVEEFRMKDNRPTWAIDVHVPSSTELREIEIDALDSRVVAMWTETAEEEAQETAIDNRQPTQKMLTPR